MNILNLFSSNEFVHALGWTILHSVWQIALMAILLSILMIILKKSSSSIRYYVSVVALLITFLIAVITFINEYAGYNEDEITATQVFNLTPVEQEFADAVIENTSTDWQSSFLNDFRSYFERNLPLIVVIWNLIVMLLFLKIIGGLAYSQRLKSYQTYSMPEQWEAKLFKLSKKLGIRRSIQILQSAIIKVPVVVGYFKPVIILPLGVISGFSHNQVEAILAHELAHIKRNDYMINIFQSIIEVLFFYHPAIYWISKNIRNERENACDDLAILADIDRKALATALTNLEVLNHEKTLLALAFSGNKASLFNRVKRILNPQKTKVTMKEGIITIFILLASLTIMSFSSNIIKNSQNDEINTKSLKANKLRSINRTLSVNRSDLKINEKQLVNDESTVILDTIIRTDGEQSTINYSKDGVSYRLIFDANRNVKKFYANGKEIPKSEWGDYKKEIEFGFDTLKKHEIELKKHQAEMAKHETEMKKHEADLARHEAEMVAHEKELREQKEEMLEKRKELQEHKEELAQHEMEMKRFEKELVEHEKQMKKHELEMIEHEKQMKIHEHKMQIVESLIDEMKKDGLIEKDAVSYRINFTENELVINGKKQSDKIHKKYKQMFEEKSKGAHKLDVKLDVNPDYNGKTEEEVLKLQMVKLERQKADLIAQEKKLSELSVKLKLEMSEAQKNNTSNKEKKRIQEEFTKKHETILQEQKKLQFEVQQLEIEHKNLIKRMNKK